MRIKYQSLGQKIHFSFDQIHFELSTNTVAGWGGISSAWQLCIFPTFTSTGLDSPQTPNSPDLTNKYISRFGQISQSGDQLIFFLQFKQLHLTICIFPSFISNGPPAVSRIESTWKANIFHHLNKSILECLNFRSIWSKGRPPSSNFHTMILKDWVDAVINTPILIRPSTQSAWYGVGNI